MHGSHRIVLASVMLVPLATKALAFDCPNAISETTCNASGSAICSGGGASVTCDLAINGTGTASPSIILGPHSDTAVWAWGVDGLGNNFCCIVRSVDDVTVEPADTVCTSSTVNINVYGTDLADHMWLSSSAGGLACYDTTVNGRDEDDWIYGSGDARNRDYLHGGPGDDHIVGLAGDDELYGEDGDDNLFGNEGNDAIAGGDGADVIGGGDGADDICGDDSSADDADNDIIGGDAGSDVIYDDTSTNISGGADTDYCGYNVTCDGNPAETSCSVP